MISELNHGLINNYCSYNYIDSLVSCPGYSVKRVHNYYSNRRDDTHARAAARCRPVDPRVIIPDYDT